MNNIFFKQREGKGTDDDADDDVTGECNKSCLREIDFFQQAYIISPCWKVVSKPNIRCFWKGWLN